jgi:membrane protein
VRWKFALISGFWSAVVWNLTRLAFNLYVDKYASYNKIYGSLAAVPILLFWIYLIWLMILAGAALSATLQKRLDPGPNEKQISRPISTD